MRWFAKLSIRNKLILMILAVSLTVVTLISSIRIAWDVQQAKKIMLQELSVITRLIGDRSSAALVFNDSKLARENLASLKVMHKIVHACLYKSDGSIFAEYQHNNNHNSKCPKTKNMTGIEQYYTGSRLHTLSEIQLGTNLVGWIYLGSNLTTIETRLQNQLIFALLALIAAIFTSTILASWLQKIISKPIAEITHVAKTIELQGEQTLRVKLTTNDEIGQLAQAFNAMLDALDKQNLQLRRSQKMDALGQLTGGIAHDYNNMLGVILGYAEILQLMLTDNPELLEYVNEIQHAGTRGSKLTKKLLGFARQKNSDAENLDMNLLLQNEKLMLEKTLTVRIKLIFDFEKNLWPVWLDPNDLEDAILNMSINAMHAIKGHGQLTIRTSNQHFEEIDANPLQLNAGDYVELSIADDGCGMNESQKEKIFEPFFSTKGDKGTGLGLSQVYGFVERSGGNIKVYSEPGKGTEFNLFFPRYSGVHDKKSEVNDVFDNLRGHENILLVDDEPALLKLISGMLQRQGYQVFQAENGLRALKILETESIDLLLSDVIMPEMDGYELANIVQKKYPNIRIQLASGFSDDRHIKMLDNKLHESLLNKPYKLQNLLRRIRELLG